MNAATAIASIQEAMAIWQPDPARTALTVGADVPRELLVACGWHPVRLAGDAARATPMADRYLNVGADAAVRSIAQGLLDGAYGTARKLVIANDNASHFRLFYALQALRERFPAVPEMHFFDLLHQPGEPTAAYNLTRAAQLREALGGCEEDALRRSIAAANKVRELMLRLRAQRAARRISGVDALVAHRARAILPAEQVEALLTVLLDVSESVPSIEGRPVFVTGSTQDHDGYYRVLESAGLVVVGEDDAWGDRGDESLVPADAPDPLAALVERYRSGTPAAAKFTTVERASYTAARAQDAGAELVIALIRKDDPAPRWDIPRQRERLGAIPLLLFDDLSYGCADINGFRDAVIARVGAEGTA